jgi:hypothetical protein
MISVEGLGRSYDLWSSPSAALTGRLCGLFAAMAPALDETEQIT